MGTISFDAQNNDKELQRFDIIPNSVGVIDSDYRGEIKVPLLYLGDEPISIQAGQRIAQGMLIKCHRAAFEKRDSLEDTDRGDGGFGSTGEK